MRIEREFRVTMIDNASLLQRLSQETGYFFRQLKLAWPQLRDDPIGAGRHILSEVGVGLRRAGEKNSLTALATAVLLVLSAALFVVWVGIDPEKSISFRMMAGRQRRSLSCCQIRTRPARIRVWAPDRKAVWVLPLGRGEGSAREVKKASGGGGGGQHVSATYPGRQAAAAIRNTGPHSEVSTAKEPGVAGGRHQY